LPRRYGTVVRPAFDAIGQLIELPQQNSRTVEALGLLSVAGAPHMS